MDEEEEDEVVEQTEIEKVGDLEVLTVDVVAGAEGTVTVQKQDTVMETPLLAGIATVTIATVTTATVGVAGKVGRTIHHTEIKTPRI